MSNGKAVTKKSLVDEVIKLKRENVKSYGQQRQRVTSGSYIGTSGQKGGSDSNDISTSYLKTAGDTMIGPLAFYPKTATLSTGIMDASESTGAYSSRIYVIGQGSSADDLEVILGASHAGQILFFQPIIANITLQSYLKTATAWSSGTSYSIGDVVLYNSQRYTCYVAHTSSGSITPSDSTKWHRNNIRLTGADDRVVTTDEIVMLQYDTTDGVWTLISGGGISTGAGLADNNVWTGSNTFQSSVSMTGPSVIIGNSSSDLLYIDSTISQDVNFGGNDIDNLDRLNFKETSQRLDSTPTGIEYEVPSGENHEFLVNSTIIADFDGNGLTMAGSHDLNISSGDLTNGSGHNGNFTWSGTGNFSVYADDAYLYSATTWIGNYGGGDLCKIAAMVDFRDHTSSTNQTVPTQSDGYIEVKIGGLTKKLFYYS